MEFGRFAAETVPSGEKGKPETFNFLNTHISGKIARQVC